MNEEEKITKISEGRQAGAVLQFLDPILEKLEQTTLSKMKQMYRAGEKHDVLLYSCVAQLCALDDIKTALKAKVLQSQTLSKEGMHGNE